MSNRITLASLRHRLPDYADVGKCLDGMLQRERRAQLAEIEADKMIFYTKDAVIY